MGRTVHGPDVGARVHQVVAFVDTIVSDLGRCGDVVVKEVGLSVVEDKVVADVLLVDVAGVDVVVVDVVGVDLVVVEVVDEVLVVSGTPLWVERSISNN